MLTDLLANFRLEMASIRSKWDEVRVLSSPSPRNPLFWEWSEVRLLQCGSLNDPAMTLGVPAAG